MRGRGSRKSSLSTQEQDHPRVCGEEDLPRRGENHPARITPACAGKRRRIIGDACYTAGSPPRVRGRVADQLTSRRALRDHPRACGEEAKIFRAECGRYRITPARAGKSCRPVDLSELLGITPARAGKRDSSDKRKGNTTDHPRACGEESPSLRRSIASRGSPPRVRGRVLAQLLVAPLQRITPARAGKRGSSGQASRPPRITPAYAGKSPSTLVTEFCA